MQLPNSLNKQNDNRDDDRDKYIYQHLYKYKRVITIMIGAKKP